MNDDGSKPFPTTTAEARRIVQSLAAPINKVGLLLLRDVQGDDPLVCLTQVKAKNPAEQHKVHFGLPKGTRQYFDRTDNTMKDARDWQVAEANKATLEPLSSTLMSEAEQEIGLPRSAYAQTALHELGSRLFSSRNMGTTYTVPHDIHWYVMEATRPILEKMDPSPKDAYQVQWFPLSQVRAMEAEGKINACYVDVLEEAVEKLRNRELRPAQFSQAQQTI